MNCGTWALQANPVGTFRTLRLHKERFLNTLANRPQIGVGAGDPAAKLTNLVRLQLQHAVDGVRDGLKVYESLRNLNEVIGTQYSDRVLYELIQNAHDAHSALEQGKIAVKLIVNSPDSGVLYVANGGAGFTFENVEAVRNLAISSKEVGEGIGNKGLGFRSIEALTDDVRIYSKQNGARSDRFDGFCFRFASRREIKRLLEDVSNSAFIRTQVADTIPRYLVSVPLVEQPPEISAFAQAGYATVVALPLTTASAVQLATAQAQALTALTVPLLLFLDRIAEVRLDVELPNQPPIRRVLRRREEAIGDVDQLKGCSLHRVDVGDQQRFLVVRRQVDKALVIEAVNKSIQLAPQLRRWLNWKGNPIVSIAVSLDRKGVSAGRLYNFLPMGDTAIAPVAGYLDAPFFTDIDRTQAKLDLPLNSFLLTAAAEACASAALHIVKSHVSVAPTTVFDLIAWGSPFTSRIDNALKKLATSLRDAGLIPAISSDGQTAWTSLAEATMWPPGTYTVLKARDVAKHAGSSLISPQLGERRVDRLNSLARSMYRNLSPSADRLGGILESFALSLSDRSVSARVWTDFYEEVVQVCSVTGTGLRCLEGKQILMDRSGRLRPAMRESSEAQKQVYVRGETRGRTKAGIPLPPQSLSRRYFFLDERISLSAETLQAFVKEKLLRPYDPVEALAGLQAALGRQPTPERRTEALVWAFEIWKSAGESVEDALREANLSVPAQGGWVSAVTASFSDSWTSIGSSVENYLIETATLSNDCKNSGEALLTSWSNWPKRGADAKRDWIRFLEVIGVADGLRPIAAQIDEGGNASWLWTPLVQRGDQSRGFDKDWCEEAKSVSFGFPNTYYTMRGEAWRFPGQIEFSNLHNPAKRMLSHLILDHLKQHGIDFFAFSVGRYDRSERDWNEQILSTPLAVFVRSKPWIAANSREDFIFCKPSSCWSARTRRSGVPRFVNRLPEEMFADVLESGELSNLLFSEEIGLRDWQSITTAAERLHDLAAVARDISSTDRAVFRREYRRGWLEVSQTRSELGYDLSVVISRRGEMEVLKGSMKAPPELIVTNDPSCFEVKALSGAGRAVLDIGEASMDAVNALLSDTYCFTPLGLKDVSVQLTVDGVVFEPSAGDPLFVESGFDWLPECAAIGHAVRAEQLEKGVLRSTIETRVRAIRLRRCESISLLIDGAELPSEEETLFYGFEHNESPTLILANRVPLNWRTLARTAETISRLVDHRLRTLKTLISDLLIERSKQDLEPPSAEDLAVALKCDIQIIQEHILEFRTDIGRVIQMLLPVVAYYGGFDAARQFRSDADRLGVRFDPAVWLGDKLSGIRMSPPEVVDLCKRVADRAELRRLLNLDFSLFNRALGEIDEPLISNELELRLSYLAHLQKLKPEMVDRLRRYYFGTYTGGGELDEYVSRKTLEFIPFDESWIETNEVLEPGVVEAHATRILDETLGGDVVVSLRSLTRVLDTNRKTVQLALREALPLITVWCRKNNVQVPPLWSTGDSVGVLRHLENKGLLDFELIKVSSIPSMCRRAGCWPPGMKETIDRKELGLVENDMQEEARRRDEEKKKTVIAQRTIVFAGAALDTGSEDFSGKFTDIAGQAIAANAAWYERSSARVKLEMFADTTAATRGPSGGSRGGRWNGEKQSTEAQRQAMGMAGEWLAYQYLLKRHEGYVDEASWVSGNRHHFFGGDVGQDGAGYDFRVVTPRVEWFYEVKSTLADGCEFEITANELRVASGVSKDGRRRYRILYVRHVFSPNEWYVLELPNPMGERTRNQFQTLGQGSLRMRFESL